MQNLLDYLEWRGDLSFACDGFNEIDNLIMSTLAYLEYDGIVPYESGRSSISLLKASECYAKNAKQSSVNPFIIKIPELLLKASQTTRYCDVQLSGYDNQIDYEQSKQFAAVVFSINNKKHFIAFRGTDDNIIGWKEDLQMSFMSETQAQKQSAIYINRIFSSLKGNFYLGGHSKGGNLAVYAATHATKKMRNRIIEIYNNDGPGFQTNIIQSSEYQDILGKINTLVPKSSIVGMLLEHGEEYRVVNSCETGVMQHDAFSWEVKGTNFVYVNGLTQNSLNINNTIRACLNKLSIEERALFVNALFDIIQSTGAKTIGELSKDKLVIANTMIKTYKNMDSSTRSNLKKTIEIFFEESQKTLKNRISTGINLLLLKK